MRHLISLSAVVGSALLWSCHHSTPGCQDDCAAGQVECIGTGVRACGGSDTDACLHWGAIQACSDGQLCTNGACYTPCTSECAAGSVRCSEGLIQSCDDFNGDACLEWGGDLTCLPTESCHGSGVCLPDGVDILYISTVGDDGWSGSLDEPNADLTDGPLATLTGARDALRRLKATGPLSAPVLVLFREGTYGITAPVELAPEDSGSAEFPITYGAYPGERPTLSGGRLLTGWQVQNDGRWTLAIPEVAAGTWSFGALWVNGERRPRARTPNDGYFYTAGPATPANQAFQFAPGDLSVWPDFQDAIVIVYHSWATSLHHIASVDPGAHVVTFTGPSIWSFEYWGSAQRYRVENVAAALDEPGEWTLNSATGLLTYLPLAGESPDTVQVVAPVALQLIVLRGDAAQAKFVDHLTFQDLTLAHTDWQPGPAGFSSGQAAVGVTGAVEAIGARGVHFVRCTFEHLGTYAAWWRAGSQGSSLEHCELTDLGAGGVMIGEQGSLPAGDQEVKDDRVDNCFIHDGGRILSEGVGVWIGRSSYNQITHNEICDLDYSGVSVGWSWGYDPSSAHDNLVAHNHIHHIGRGVLSDMGGIYTLGVSPGTSLLHNQIHDVVSFSYGGWGLYNDEGSSTILLSENLVYSTKSGSYHQHYGEANEVRNNILAYAQEAQLIRTREEDHLSFNFEHNIVLYNNQRLLGSNWTNGQYFLDSNLYWDSGLDVSFNCLDLAAWQTLGQDVHSQVADPRFVDPQHFDFHLNADSPAPGLGFVPFSLDDFGLYGDAAWVAKPKQIVRPATALPIYPDPPIVDDFEATPVGSRPAGAAVNGETAAATIRVSDEQARSGTHSVKLHDAPGLDYVWNPHLVYQPSLRSGALTGSFAVRLGTGAVLAHEWRDWHVSPYVAGPSLTIDASGVLTASGAPLAVTIPRDTWVVFTIHYALGAAASGQYQLTVDIDGQGAQLFDNLGAATGAPCTINWIGFIALSDADTVIYLDDVAFGAE